MLDTIAVVLLFLWLLGLGTSSTVGSLIHILLATALVAVLLRLIGARRRAEGARPLMSRPLQRDRSRSPRDFGAEREPAGQTSSKPAD